MLRQTAIFLLAAGRALAACNYGTYDYPRGPNVPVSSFSYTGLTGPLNWYGLNKTANALCAKGMNQSPINFNASSCAAKNDSSVVFKVVDYPNGAEFENLGTNVEVVANGSLTVDCKNYTLAQFHFHTPSEHRVDQEYASMEAHFVFNAPDKSIAVVAFMIELGPADPLLADVFQYVSAIATPGTATLTGPLSFSGLEDHFRSSSTYRYSGSLTTPPCSESVAWIIACDPLYIDPGTYAKVKRVVKFNSRYTEDTLGTVNLLQNEANALGGS